MQIHEEGKGDNCPAQSEILLQKMLEEDTYIAGIYKYIVSLPIWVKMLSRNRHSPETDKNMERQSIKCAL